MGEMSLRDEHGRFARGHSGNPAGRPPGVTVYEAVQKLLKEVDPNGVMRVDRIAAKVVERMEEADPVLLAMIVDRETPKIIRNQHQDVSSFEASIDRYISDMMAQPEGQERLAAMQREAWQEMAPSGPGQGSEAEIEARHQARLDNIREWTGEPPEGEPAPPSTPEESAEHE